MIFYESIWCLQSNIFLQHFLSKIGSCLLIGSTFFQVMACLCISALFKTILSSFHISPFTFLLLTLKSLINILIRLTILIDNIINIIQLWNEFTLIIADDNFLDLINNNWNLYLQYARYLNIKTFIFIIVASLTEILGITNLRLIY